MTDYLPATTTDSAVSHVTDTAGDALRCGILLTRLAYTGQALRHMSNLTRDAFTYIEDCARNVDQLAETAATLKVDPSTVAEHHQAAQFMRVALATAQEMANHCDEMSTQFEQAKRDHEADYGPVTEAARAMPVQMADRAFYSNR